MKVREERNKAELSNVLKSFFQVPSLELSSSRYQMSLHQLLDDLVHGSQVDMHNIACSEALDSMQAYYSVALKRFIDDIAVEAIEAKLITPLYDIFSPMTVFSMPTELVTAVAGESDESHALRKQLTNELDTLTKGFETCERFVRMRVSNSENGTIQLPYRSQSAVEDPQDLSDSDYDSSESLKVTPNGVDDTDTAHAGSDFAGEDVKYVDRFPSDSDKLKGKQEAVVEEPMEMENYISHQLSFKKKSKKKKTKELSEGAYDTVPEQPVEIF